MKNSSLLFLILLFSFLTINSFAQEYTIKGSVIDGETKEPLIGVNITLKGKLSGTITDTEGNFVYNSKIQPPFILVFSSVGYAKVEREIEQSDKKITITMHEQTILGQEVVVSASRIEENIMKSPVSVEKLSLMDIQQTNASNFYDELYKLKGVDMTVHSLAFRFPNTRGFSGETNYRLNQIIDGVDNVAPGLSFAAGNLFGVSQLDLESVELVVGASSALYGPGGMNGTLIMTSKNPFDYQGLSFNAQVGVMHVNADYNDGVRPMTDLSLRYAKAFHDKLAFKINAYYLRAEDWNASDYRDRTDLENPNLNRQTNPGYDGVNVYGDDIVVPVNLKDVGPSVADAVAQQQGYQPGSSEYESLYNKVIGYFPDQLVSRTGWKEKDLVDYNTENLRLNGSVHYRINNNLEAVAGGNYSRGTSVYTAQNRFSVRGFDIFSGKLELNSPHYVVRAWGVTENSGDTYDAGGAALRLNETWKPSETWYQEYIGAYTQTMLLGGTYDDAHAFARLVADNRDQNGNIFAVGKPAIPVPGTDEFNQMYNDIISKPVNQGGAHVLDRSKMFQVEGMYNFNHLIHAFELLVGASHRIYSINSDGTVFFDQPGNPIMINQFGAYAQLGKDILHKRVKITASARYDKNENFKGVFTPRFSAVWSLDPTQEHNIRMSYQTAFRFPSISDQWVDIAVGPYQVIGGLPQVQQKYNFDTNPVYPLSGSNPIIDKPVTDQGPYTIPAFGPEKVTAMELGYKGLSFNKKLFVDGYVFKNIYTGFLATQLLAQNPNTTDEKRYQTVVSTDEPVSSYGWALGADLRLVKGYFLRGNIAYNKLITETTTPGLQARFNTPDYRFNISIGNKEVVKNVGFNVNYHWQNAFYWESNFGASTITAYGTLDGHISYKLSALKSILKVGGSNLLNHYYTTTFGSAQIGGLYYVSLTFDQFMN